MFWIYYWYFVDLWENSIVMLERTVVRLLLSNLGYKVTDIVSRSPLQ